jgi:hypothetical protein
LHGIGGLALACKAAQALAGHIASLLDNLSVPAVAAE